jgi:hypothetical protein
MARKWTNLICILRLENCMDRLAESEQEFVAESIERGVRLLAANLISALTLTFQPESDLQDKKFMQSLQYIKKF